MRLILLICFVSFCSATAQAQYEPPTFEMPEELNTVGINLTPLAVIALNGTPVTSRISLVYKRQTKVNRKLRAFLDYELIDFKDEDLQSASVAFFNDSTITYKMEYVNHFAYGARLGMEWFKPDKKITGIYGIDFQVGVHSNEKREKLVTYRKDASCDNCITEDYTTPATTESYKVNSLAMGIDFSAGMKFQIKDRLDAVLQFAPELYFLIPIDEQFSTVSARTSSASTTFEMNIRGVELYMHYSF